MAQDDPKSSQERPKSAQGAPQESPGAAQEAQETPRAPQERPTNHLGMNLEPPGLHFRRPWASFPRFFWQGGPNGTRNVVGLRCLSDKRPLGIEPTYHLAGTAYTYICSYTKAYTYTYIHAYAYFYT